MPSVARREIFARLLGRNKTPEPITLSTATCLAWNGTLCYSCKEVCQPDAITLFAMARAVIDLQRCTLCGECVPICPVGAIVMDTPPRELS